MQIAFYAPLKPPTHPIVSGDRQVARLLMRALARSAHDVVLVSEFRSYLRAPGGEEEKNLRDLANAERDRITNAINDGAMRRPDIWFSYHPYYKSPDWLGPFLSEELGIPYVTAESSYAGKRDKGEWAHAQAEVRAGLQKAALNFHMTKRDRVGLIKAIGHTRTLEHLPPFIDLTGFADPSPKSHDPVRLLAVAMMRDDVKLQSYRFLAHSLAGLSAETAWQLDVVGDGEARGEVENAFAEISNINLTFHGALDAVQLRARYKASDLFVWPGFGEAYGMAYLEAQAHGLPVIALNTAGVPEVVRDGVSGSLVLSDNPDAYAAAISHFIDDSDERARFGVQAYSSLQKNHSLTAAAAQLDTALKRLVLDD